MLCLLFSCQLLISSEKKIEPKEKTRHHVLVKDGKTEFIIVRPSNTYSGFVQTVNDMAAILKKSTGAEFKIVLEGKENTTGKNIYVGATNFAMKNISDFKSLKQWEWRFKSVGDNIIITGAPHASDRFSIYDFLGKYLGCRWYDETTELIPTNKNIVLPLMNVKAETAFQCMYIGTIWYAIYKGDAKKQYANGLFRLRNKDNPPRTGKPGGCHTFWRYIKAWEDSNETTPDEHPEYYSMDKRGKRKVPGPGIRAVSFGHLCLSNPEVSKLLGEQLKEFIRNDIVRANKRSSPYPDIYDISQNDPGGRICNCEKCMKIINSEGGTDAALLLHALNPIAKSIEKEFPKIKIQTFAYKFGVLPPKTIKANDNLLIRIADLGREWSPRGGNKNFPTRDQLFPITHPINSRSYDLLSNWRSKAKNLALWGYWGIYREKFNSPYVITQCMRPDLQTYIINHVKSIYVELDANVTTMSFFALTRWVGYKMMENPYQSMDVLIDDFMNGYYGSAAAPFMKKYLRYLENRIIETNTPLNELRVENRPYLDYKFFTTVQKLLDKAEATCPNNSKERFHVQRERISVDCALLNLWGKLSKSLSYDQKSPFDYQRVYERYKKNRIEQAKSMVSTKYYNNTLKEQIDYELQKLRFDSHKKREKLKTRRHSLDVTKLETSTCRKPNKVIWDKVKPTSTWYTIEGYELDKSPSVKAAYNNKRIYLKLEEPEGENLYAGASPWSSDNWEIILAAGKKYPYYHLTIDQAKNIRQLKFKKKGASEEWDSEAEIISEKKNGKWIVYVSIPFKTFLSKDELAKKTIYTNFYRNRKNRKTSKIWSPTFCNTMHNLIRLGELKLQ